MFLTSPGPVGSSRIRLSWAWLDRVKSGEFEFDRAYSVGVGRVRQQEQKRHTVKKYLLSAYVEALICKVF